MIADWLRPVEQIVLAARGAGLRVVGITSPHVESGVSTLSKEVAENYGSAGIRTLLVDMTAPVGEATFYKKSWFPGQSGALKPIRTLTAGYDQLTCLATNETRFLFNNTELLRRTLDNELDQYAAVILDLPPLLAQQPDLLNSLAIAVACDAVCIVCVTGGITHNELTTVSQMLKTTRVHLLGIVLNDFVAPRQGKWFKKRTFAGSRLT